MERPSLLAHDHPDNKEFKLLESVFVAFLIYLGLYIWSEDYFEKGAYFPDFELITWCFGKF